MVSSCPSKFDQFRLSRAFLLKTRKWSYLLIPVVWITLLVSFQSGVSPLWIFSSTVPKILACNCLLPFHRMTTLTFWLDAKFTPFQRIRYSLGQSKWCKTTEAPWLRVPLNKNTIKHTSCYLLCMPSILRMHSQNIWVQCYLISSVISFCPWQDSLNLFRIPGVTTNKAIKFKV